MGNKQESTSDLIQEFLDFEEVIKNKRNDFHSSNLHIVVNNTEECIKSTNFYKRYGIKSVCHYLIDL